ncbi:MAG: hypothetical protein WD009_06835 [Phycisphaeraceae bacterium]
MMRHRGNVLSMRCCAAVLGAAAVGLAVQAASADVLFNVVNMGGFGGQTVPDAINNNGEVVGSSFDPSLGVSGQGRAFLYAYGQMLDLGSYFDRTQHRAFDINDSGQVVGFASHQVHGTSSLLTDSAGGDWTLIHNGYSNSIGRGINEAGWVVGNVTPVGDTNYYAYVHRNPTAGSYNPADVTVINPLPGDVRSQAVAINVNPHNANAPIVGGVSLDSNNDQHAFIWTPDHGTLNLHAELVNRAASITGGDELLWSTVNAVTDANRIVGTIALKDADTDETYLRGYNYRFSGDVAVKLDDPTLPSGTFGLHSFFLADNNTFANDANTSAHTVGSFIDDDGIGRAMIHANTLIGQVAPADLNDYVELPDGWWLSTATGINESGQIIARAADGTVEFGQLVSNHAMLLTPITLPTSPVGTGENVTIRLSGGAEAGGGSNGVTILFNNVESPGEVHVNYAPIDADTYPDAPFILPNPDSGQAWNIAFDGELTGHATLTFAYDPDLLPDEFDPTLLAIYHLEDEQWLLLENQFVDPLNHTITAETSSFSPFVLGVIPEPTSAALLAAGTLVLLRRHARTSAPIV